VIELSMSEEREGYILAVLYDFCSFGLSLLVGDAARTDDQQHVHA
jgi:hypothetical protein